MQKDYEIDDVIDKINKESPRIVFIGGKTCTGKSTLARTLSEYGYSQIELDQVVRKYICKKFEMKDQSMAFSVYKGIAPIKWQSAFEEESSRIINALVLKNKIVIDAAISEPKVLRVVLKNNIEDPMIVYLHPFDRNFYYHGIFNRFSQDVVTKKRSFPIWDFITKESLNDFNTNGEKGPIIGQIVAKYCDNSIKSSKQRYINFKTEFPNTILSGH